MRCLTHRSVWDVQHRLEEGLVGRWAGWRRLWSIYKPRPKQNFFQPPSHLPDPQTKAEDGGGGGGGGEGRPVFIVLPRRNWAFCLRRDLLHHETAKTYWEQKEEMPLCLSLHRSPPSSFREKLSTFMFSLLYPSSVCKPLEYSVRPRINVDDVHLFKHWFSFMFWSRLGRDHGLEWNAGSVSKCPDE